MKTLLLALILSTTGYANNTGQILTNLADKWARDRVQPAEISFKPIPSHHIEAAINAMKKPTYQGLDLPDQEYNYEINNYNFNDFSNTDEY